MLVVSIVLCHLYLDVCVGSVALCALRGLLNIVCCLSGGVFFSVVLCNMCLLSIAYCTFMFAC